MPRSPRVDYPGAVHHVYSRGIEKRVIFADDDDRRELWRRVEYNLPRFHGRCLAWALMPNHFHLLYQSSAGDLPGFMRCLMSGYAMHFNRKSGRVGHLFQNRYKSVPITSEPYLLELIRYIHLNPVRSGIVSSLDELGAYRWTAHWGIVRTKRFPWEDFEFLRDYFAAGQEDNGYARYLRFLDDGIRCRPVVAFSDRDDRCERAWPPSCDELPVPDIPDDQRRLCQDVAATACRDRGITLDRLLKGPRSRVITEVRRAVLRTCILDYGISRRAVSLWLGITNAGGGYLLRGKKTGRVRCKEEAPLEKFKNVPELSVRGISES